jgi:hypothetical protein
MNVHIEQNFEDALDLVNSLEITHGKEYDIVRFGSLTLSATRANPFASTTFYVISEKITCLTLVMLTDELVEDGVIH